MKITVVRHGQSESNQLGILQGLGNSPLSKKGKLQAEKLQAEFRNKFDRVYCSPLIRAIQTAKISLINIHQEEEFIILDELKEIDVGIFDGMVLSELNSEQTAILIKCKADYDFCGHEGESINNLLNRVAGIFNRIIKDMKKENLSNIIIFSHGGWIGSLINRHLSLIDDELNLNNCEFLVLENTDTWKIINR